MTPAFFPAVRDAVRALNAEGRTRVLVISSTGKHFSAGMALDVFAGGTWPDAATGDAARRAWPSRTACAS
jgi:enoyl-CoA hydratase